MDVTPQELRGSEIKDAWRGYDRDEVDDLLERAAVTIEHLTLQVQEVAAHPPIAAAAAVTHAPEQVPLPSSRDDAEMLQRTLLLAQRAADDAVNEAQARARQIVEEAEAKAQALVGDAEATARRIAEGERRRLEAEIQELSARRELLRTDADALDAYAAGYRDKLRSTIEADLVALTTGAAIEAPSARPQLHEVEIPSSYDSTPEPPSAHAEASRAPVAAAPAPAPASAPASWDTGTDTRVIAPEASAAAPVIAAPPVAPAPAPQAPAPEASQAGQATAQGEWPPTATRTEAAPAEAGWLAAEEWSAEPALDAPAPWERDTGYHEPFASDTPMEATSVDTDSLSDDQFFASLREAVRDEAPLGSSDDPSSVQGDFFDPDPDADAEADRRRFRRRR